MSPMAHDGENFRECITTKTEAHLESTSTKLWVTPTVSEFAGNTQGILTNLCTRLYLGIHCIPVLNPTATMHFLERYLFLKPQLIIQWGVSTANCNVQNSAGKKCDGNLPDPFYLYFMSCCTRTVLVYASCPGYL